MKIGTLVSDRHKKTSKWLIPKIVHRYDIWNPEKYKYALIIIEKLAFYPMQISSCSIIFGKMIDKMAKEKKCELVGKWKKSLINHLYWSAASTTNGNGEVILSVDNHIHNKRRNHSKLVPKCKHKTFQARDRKKKWFKHCKWGMSNFYNSKCKL